MARKIIISSRDSRSLIWVDAEPIKREERRKCLELMKRMEAARETLRRFHEENRPAFEQWLYATFGEQITVIRELSAKFEQVEFLIAEIQDYKYRAGSSFNEAYAAVMKRRKRPSVEEETFEEPDSDEEFQETFGESPPGGDQESDFSGQYQREERLQPSEGHQDRDDRLKRLYLSLVRKLHPDKNPNLGKKHKELWHQIQEAYETKDLDRMETLSAMSDLYDNQAESTESLWSLGRLHEELKAALKQLQKEINRSKKDLSWNFEKVRESSKKLRELHRKIALDLEFSRMDLQEKLEYCENLIEKWKRPQARRGAGVRKSRGRSRF